MEIKYIRPPEPPLNTSPGPFATFSCWRDFALWSLDRFVEAGWFHPETVHKAPSVFGIEDQEDEFSFPESCTVQVVTASGSGKRQQLTEHNVMAYFQYSVEEEEL